MFRLARFRIKSIIPRQFQRATSNPHSLRFPHLLDLKTIIGASTVTTAYFLYLWYFDNEKPPSDYSKKFEAVVLRRLPSNAYSQFIGSVANLNIPKPFRRLIFSTYATLTRCNVAEAKLTDLSEYSTLGQFFTRELAPGVRPIDDNALINSPADGTVIYVGSVDDQEVGLLTQVKGSTFRMEEFLGPTGTLRVGRKDRQLCQCVIYLCPGDYHRFHSPADWRVKMRRHFHGKLLSVRPSLLASLPGVFVLNERVSYLGEWRHGFLSLTAVGAAGVGSVVIESAIDPSLCTNRTSAAAPERREPGQHYDQLDLTGVASRLGTPFGYFQMGSSIVLVFEAPKRGYTWSVQSGDRVKCGVALMKPSTA